MPERGLELCFTEDGTVASPRTIARPHCRAELCGSAEQSQASVQEELGLAEDWSRTSRMWNPRVFADDARGSSQRWLLTFHGASSGGFAA